MARQNPTPPAASFLSRVARAYLAASSPRSHGYSLFKIGIMRLRGLWLVLTKGTPAYIQAQLAHLQACIYEVKLGAVDSDRPEQRGEFHLYRRLQLEAFEQILSIYDHADPEVSPAKNPLFSELLLVMATIVEDSADTQTPAMVSLAKVLLARYHELRLLLKGQLARWTLPPSLKLDVRDPVIAQLLEFRTVWEAFRQAKVSLWKAEPHHEAMETALNTIHPRVG